MWTGSTLVNSCSIRLSQEQRLSIVWWKSPHWIRATWSSLRQTSHRVWTRSTRCTIERILDMTNLSTEPAYERLIFTTDSWRDFICTCSSYNNHKNHRINNNHKNHRTNNYLIPSSCQKHLLILEPLKLSNTIPKDNLLTRHAFHTNPVTTYGSFKVDNAEQSFILISCKNQFSSVQPCFKLRHFSEACKWGLGEWLMLRSLAFSL